MSAEKEKSTSAYDRVVIARSKGRATASDYIAGIFTDFTELHGDRRFADDKAIISGIAMLGERAVTVIGIERGHDTKDKIDRNFGSAHPEGYRKALRQMKLAEKFGRPVICLVDTSGAYCGIEAEERGQGQAIAENLEVMSTLRVPLISILIGEGGSGGALALAVADEVWMLENSIYSVISPEGCASILWKDPKKVREAAECLKFTAEDLYKFGVIEKIIPETSSQTGAIASITNFIAGEKEDFSEVFAFIKAELSQKLAVECQTDIGVLLEKRYRKFRKIGEIK